MPDHDIGGDAHRDRIKERGRAGHAEPGQLRQHVEITPRRRLRTALNYYRSRARLPS